MYREHILDTAEEVFAESGFDGTKMKAVATAAAISLSTLYSHFEPKLALYRGVHARRLTALMAQLKAAGRPEATRLTQMLDGIAVYVAFHIEHPNYLRMHLRDDLAWSQPDRLRSPEQLGTWKRGIERMARTFGGGMRDGIFVEDDPILCARTTNAMHQVALSHWVDTGMEESASAVIGRIHQRFLRTFCTPDRVPALLAELDERGTVDNE